MRINTPVPFAAFGATQGRVGLCIKRHESDASDVASVIFGHDYNGRWLWFQVEDSLADFGPLFRIGAAPAEAVFEAP